MARIEEAYSEGVIPVIFLNCLEIRLHDFRHSCASLLINKGANIQVVAKYLGHTKIEETLGSDR